MNRRILDFLRRPGARFFEPSDGGSTSWTFSQAESAEMLPSSSIWISQFGVTTGSFGVSVWSSSFGGINTVLTAPVPGDEPAYELTGGVGGRPLIVPDGLGDTLEGTFTKGSVFDNGELGFVGRAGTGEGTAARVFGYHASSTQRWSVLRHTPPTEMNTSRNDGSSVTTNDTTNRDGEIGHWTAITDETNLRILLNGVEMANAGSGQAVSFADGGTIKFFEYAGAATNRSTSAAQAGYIGPRLSDEQRTYLRALLTYYTGVDC